MVRNEKPIRDCDLEDLKDATMNLYLYAVQVLKGRLPDEYHREMERYRRERPDDNMVKGYFEYLKKKRSLLDRIKSLIGVSS